ncbi:MAG: 3-hydroxyacyl-ACP dehydratase FabZ [Rhodospirillales bacterium]|jgi:3-hydroxyacyl-[acyl-carrier-protein] dehydratase|nr:3-hydroxyacyl-ACP dehydratase FabZ [Rhodospirillales bacterium]HIJ42475.1 3-hydroxyacyl-ACP dehydratase FabZ [Rhodospirillaceae bacterium]MDP7098110.1 3-hydroxyacyl-ACP dehydratase FabZ [Rhodospirillales bacterium]MDP7216084.1 3-hydroxyacyl-ACP dehydratase FabZ [Rhodospirillales bacterium]HIJ44685.1 3-hydroxyacyl-ACP dehydratase FabZ [Rhodospirillaceae bacterium]
MDENSPSTLGKTLDINQIKEKIPHRYPFLMIDRVIGLVADTRAVGVKNVSINEAFFQGHFPSQPIMPGVLIIEAMAQTSAVLVMETLGKSAEGTLVYFMSVDQARFRKPVTPGDTLHVSVEKIRQRGSVWKFKGEAKVDGIRMADAIFAAMIIDE